jgi:hypothetical protein
MRTAPGLNWLPQNRVLDGMVDGHSERGICARVSPEGDHGSTYFHPDSSAARMVIQCQVELQRLAGGNALIGRQLYPLMVEAGLSMVRVSPRVVYVDSSRPDLVDGFTTKTFTAMIEGIRESAIEAGIANPETFDAGVRDLRRTAEADGVFCYTFFKGVGQKARRAQP